jgi:hypothetical protein
MKTQKQSAAQLLAQTQPTFNKFAIGVALMVLTTAACAGQSGPTESSKTHEMILAPDAFVAIDTPKGWVRSEGPGLAYFLREGDKPRHADVWIYVDYADTGQHAKDKDMNSFINSDIAAFKRRFKNGTVQREDPLALPRVKSQATVYSFRSGERKNAFEEIAYIGDVRHVWILALSATNRDALTSALPAFRDFVQTYGGSIIMGSPDEK